MEQRKKSFLVDVWTIVLKRLEKISLFYFVRNKILPNYTKNNYRFVDHWLISHTILAILFVFIAYLQHIPIWTKYILLVYGSIRVFEIFIYQLNVFLIHPYNSASYTLNSYRRMTIALIHNFFEIVFWFAGTYITLQFIANIDPSEAIYNSFTHMVTFSLTIDESKWSVFTVFILQFQALIGVFMTVLSLARFVSLFPQPRSLDEFEQVENDQPYEFIMEEIRVIRVEMEHNSDILDCNQEALRYLSNLERKVDVLLSEVLKRQSQ